MTVLPAVPAALYHYTCTVHGEPGIRATRMVRPSLHLLLRVHLAWLTDMPYPDRWALGLTNYTLGCDRTEIRVTVGDHKTVRPWWRFARDHADRIPRVMREIIEQDGQPMHWWVSLAALDATALVATADLHLHKATR